MTPVMNPLLFDNTNALEKSRVTQEILQLLKTRIYHEFSGPRFDELVRLLVDTLLDPGYPVVPSLVDAPSLLTDTAWAKKHRFGADWSIKSLLNGGYFMIR